MSAVTPLHSFTKTELRSLYSSVPQWHALAEGPIIPFTAGSRSKVYVDCIFVVTREEAVECLWDHIKAACADEGMIFSEDDWTVKHVVLVGAS